MNRRSFLLSLPAAAIAAEAVSSSAIASPSPAYLPLPWTVPALPKPDLWMPDYGYVYGFGWKVMHFNRVQECNWGDLVPYGYAQVLESKHYYDWPRGPWSEKRRIVAGTLTRPWESPTKMVVYLRPDETRGTEAEFHEALRDVLRKHEREACNCDWERAIEAWNNTGESS